MISIVIITLNEEKNLGVLLESLLKQTYKDFEVLVIDSNSTDNTEKVANSYKKKFPKFVFYNMKKKGISAARNTGAMKAKGRYIFFMDADISLKKDFLMKSVNDLKRKKLDVAGVYMKAMGKNILDISYYGFLNFWFFIMQRVYPHVIGGCMIAKKEVHKRINGFDNGIRLAEDNDYVNRARKYFKFGMIDDYVLISVRRFEKEGRLKMGIKYILVFFYRIIFGEIRTDIFKYRFGNYENK